MFFAPLKILDSKKTNSSITIRVVAQSKAHEKFTEVKKLRVAEYKHEVDKMYVKLSCCYAPMTDNKNLNSMTAKERK